MGVEFVAGKRETVTIDLNEMQTILRKTVAYGVTCICFNIVFLALDDFLWDVIPHLSLMIEVRSILKTRHCSLHSFSYEYTPQTVQKL